MIRWGLRNNLLDARQLVFFTPVPILYFKTYHLIDERSLTAKLAVAGTIIKGMHSIRKNPITFYIREIKFISGVGQGQSLLEKMQEMESGGDVEGSWKSGGGGEGRWESGRGLCGVNTTHYCVWCKHDA